jgi:ribonuclease P protein component
VRRAPTPLGHPRVALLVPKLGQTIVRRNKLKRRLRELARLHLLPCSSSSDILLRARREAYDAPYAELRNDIARIASQLT